MNALFSLFFSFSSSLLRGKKVNKRKSEKKGEGKGKTKREGDLNPLPFYSSNTVTTIYHLCFSDNMLKYLYLYE
jgi:hypothetical protein